MLVQERRTQVQEKPLSLSKQKINVKSPGHYTGKEGYKRHFPLRQDEDYGKIEKRMQFHLQRLCTQVNGYF